MGRHAHIYGNLERQHRLERQQPQLDGERKSADPQDNDGTNGLAKLIYSASDEQEKKTEAETGGQGRIAPKTVAPSEEDLESWRAMFRRARDSARRLRMYMARVPSRETRCGWDPLRNGPPCVDWALDHILYNEERFELDQLWETIEADEESKQLGLPNTRCPSDHLPIGASFLIKERLKPSPGRAEELTVAAAALVQRQQLEIENYSQLRSDSIK